MRGLSIAELARAASLTESTVYRLEAEGRKPRADTLEAVARALDVTADELLGISPLHRVEVPSNNMAHIPLLRTAEDVEEASQTMAVPRYMLPDGLPLEVLAVAVPDEAAPDLCPDDLVIVARHQEWTDGDLLCVVAGDRLLLRRGYHEANDHVLAVGRDIADRALIPDRDVVGRVMWMVIRV